VYSRLFLTLLLCLSVLDADSYPKTFAKLGTPLFQCSKKLSKFTDIETLTPEIIKFQTQVLLATKNGKKVDSTQDKQEIRAYLLELRKLQKNYDFLLHLIHKEILKSIKEQEYDRFIKLTSLELQGLIENTNIQNKSIAFYKKNKKKKKSKLLEKKIQNNTLFEATTQEFYNEIVESSYSSKDKDTKPKKSVSIYTTRVKNEIQVYFLNSNFYDVTVRVNTSYKNIKESKGTAKEFVVKAKSSKIYTTLTLTKAESSYSFSYAWIIGDKNAVHDDKYIYRLPFAIGSAHKISQGYNGSYTHKGSSKYALDFVMKKSTKVYAAREGVVVRTKSDSSRGGYKRKFAKDGNYVTIVHSDGTFATYYHLKQHGVVVKVGQYVKKGVHIGYSGNTGYSSGPHLHFAVFRAISARKTETIAVHFMAERGLVDTPLQGETYKAR
jgi:murein DD-endopeptidase MepM/ murein hydrolase activator NlpD